MIYTLLLYLVHATIPPGGTFANANNDQMTLRRPKKATSKGTKILLESFADPKHEWVEMNDPVMGGKSTGSFRIDDGVGIFDGTVNNVPFLHAPGFIQVRTTISSSSSTIFPDISHCNAFELVVASQFPQYKGYRMSFGTQHAPHGKMFAYGYKAHFTFESGDLLHANMTGGNSDDTSFRSIILPFSNYTDFWDDATGDPIVECNPYDSKDSVYCPTPQALYNIQTIGLWGEGYVGDVNLKMQAIYAVQCHDDVLAAPIKSSTMTGDSTYLNHDTSSGSTTISREAWWSRWDHLLFGHSEAETETAATSSTQPEHFSPLKQQALSSLSETTSTAATTALLLRGMLLSSLCTK